MKNRKHISSPCPIKNLVPIPFFKVKASESSTERERKLVKFLRTGVYFYIIAINFFLYLYKKKTLFQHSSDIHKVQMTLD